MEKIVIAEFAVEGIESINRDTAALVREQEKLRKSNRELDKSTVEGSKRFVENTIAMRENSKVISINNKIVQASTLNNRELSIELERENKTIAQARASNTALLKIRNQLNLSTKEGANSARLINERLDENNAFIKENVSQYEQQKINIGNYEGALRSAFPVMGSVLNVLKTTRQALVDARIATLASGEANGFLSKSLRTLRLAFISTGIGAIVVAFGSLITFLTSTQRGIDAVTKVTTPLRVIFQSLLGVIQRLGENLFDAFSNPRELIASVGESIRTNLINRFNALAKIIRDVSNFKFDEIGSDLIQAGTGVENLGDRIKNAASDAGDFFGEAIETGNQLRQLNIDIEQGEADLVLTRAKLLDQIKEQELIAKDTRLSGLERNKASEEALRISRLLSTEEKRILSLKIQQEELEQSLNDSGREDLKRLNELRAEQIKRDEEERARELKFISARAAFAKEQAAAAQAAQDLAIKNSEERLELLRTENSLRGLSDSEALEQQRIFAFEELQILRQKLDARKISQIKFNTESLKIEQDLRAIEEENEQKELERIKSFEDAKTQLQNEIRLRRELDEQAREELNAQLDFEKQVLAFENLNLQEEEKTQLLALAEEQRGIVLDEIKQKFNTKQLEDYKKVSQAEIAARKQNASEVISVTKQVTGILTGLLGDSLGAQLASIAVQAAVEAGLIGITTASSQARNLAQATASAPPPLNAPFIAAAIAQNSVMQANSSAAIGKILTSAALQGLGTVVSSARSFEEGGSTGFLRGPRHSQGGIPIEVEGGEYIFSRKTVDRIGLPMLDALNFGGVAPTVLPTNNFMDGGSTSRAIISSTNDLTRTRELIANSINDIKVINEASDTISVANEDALIVQNASF